MPKYLLAHHPYDESTLDNVYTHNSAAQPWSSSWSGASSSASMPSSNVAASFPSASWPRSGAPPYVSEPTIEPSTNIQVRPSPWARPASSSSPHSKSKGNRVKQEPGSPTFIIEPLQCSRTYTPPSPERHSRDPDVSSMSFLSQSFAPPAEVPLRATQANSEMRAMMGVFRLNPFSMHGGVPAAPDLTWCGEEPGPLTTSPKLHEWQLDNYDSGIPDDDEPVLEADLDQLHRFSPPSLDRTSGAKRKRDDTDDDGDSKHKHARTSQWPSESSRPSYNYPTVQRSPPGRVSPSYSRPDHESESDASPPERRYTASSSSSSLAGYMGDSQPSPAAKASSSPSSTGIASMLNQPHFRQSGHANADYIFPPSTPSLSAAHWPRRQQQSSAYDSSSAAYPYYNSTTVWPSDSSGSRERDRSSTPVTNNGFVMTPAQYVAEQQYSSYRLASGSSSPESYNSSAYVAQPSTSSYAPSVPTASQTYTSGLTQPRAMIPRRSQTSLMDSTGMFTQPREPPRTGGYYA